MKKIISVFISLTLLGTMAGCNAVETTVLAPSVETQVTTTTTEDPEPIFTMETKYIATREYFVNVNKNYTLEQIADEVEGYTNEELIQMAGNYFVDIYGFMPQIIDVDHVDGNIVALHCYEIVEYEDADSHTSTYDWLFIDRTTGTGENYHGDPVDLNDYK